MSGYEPYYNEYGFYRDSQGNPIAPERELASDDGAPWEGWPEAGQLGITEVKCLGPHNTSADSVQILPDGRMILRCISGCKATL